MPGFRSHLPDIPNRYLFSFTDSPICRRPSREKFERNSMVYEKMVENAFIFSPLLDVPLLATLPNIQVACN